MRRRKRKKQNQPNPQVTIQPQFQPRPFAPQSPASESVADLQTLQETTQQPERSFADVPIFTPERSPDLIPIQPKLTIGQPNDKYEQEADQVAHQVVNQINNPHSHAVQKEDAPEEKEEAVQTKLESNAFFPQVKGLMLKADRGEMTPEAMSVGVFVRRMPLVQPVAETVSGNTSVGFESSLQRAKGGGRPLTNNVRHSMEGAFNADFSRVKVHTDLKSDQLNRSIQAKAFTTGTDIFFKKGAYNPGSRGGQELLAHELTHVVQQGGASSSQSAQKSPEVQRHPNHAEEEKVQGKYLDSQPIVQRHPSHAEEEKVQGKYLDSQSIVQRHPNHAEEEKVQSKLQRQPIEITNKVNIQRLKVGKDEKDQPDEVSVKNVLKKLKNFYHFDDTKELKQALRALHTGDQVFNSWDELDQHLRDAGHASGKHQKEHLALEAKFGVPVGGESGAQQFGTQMLKKLDQLLALVPSSHLSSIARIERKKEDGASYFNYEDGVLTISYAIPAALYTHANKNTKLTTWGDARKRMEEAAMPLFYEMSGYNPDNDESLGLNTEDRSVISYSRNDDFANTPIAEWTTLHEIGHAVDRTIKWTERNGSANQFGGWKTHGDFDDPTVQEEIAKVYLEHHGLSFDDLRNKYSVDQSIIDENSNAVEGRKESIRTLLNTMLPKKVSNPDEVQDIINRVIQAIEQNSLDDANARIDEILNKDELFLNAKLRERIVSQIKNYNNRIQAPKSSLQQELNNPSLEATNQFLNHLPGADLNQKQEAAANISSLWPIAEQQSVRGKLYLAYEKLAYAQAAPWQFPDGLASKLAVDNRVYQRDHYNSWVSYYAPARANILSPYQFSSPGEWIAEAYAAYYGTNDAARNLLNDTTKAQIKEELGEPPSKAESEQARTKGIFEYEDASKPDGYKLMSLDVYEQ